MVDGLVEEEVIIGAREEAMELWRAGAFTKASEASKAGGEDPFRDGGARGDHLIWWVLFSYGGGGEGFGLVLEGY